MEIRPLTIAGAYEITPVPHGDSRGTVYEMYRQDALTEAVGHPLALAQANVSMSVRGVVRGVHYADVPPGQAKYVHCVQGALLDVIVDLRIGSPTFGRWEAVRLDDIDHRALYLAEGLGHAVCGLSERAVMTYLCSEVYAPAREHTVHPLDPELAIEWPATSPLLSARDAAAPSLAEAREMGLLPDYGACQDFYFSRRES